MSDVTPPVDPFSQPPQATPGAPAAASAKKPPWKLIVGALVVVAAVIVGVVVFTGDDDSGKSAPNGSSGGNDASGEAHLMRLDDAGVSELDAAGAVMRTITLPDGFVPAPTPNMGRWLVSEPDGAALTVVDLADGIARTLELPGADMVLDRATQRIGGDAVVFFTPAGGPLALVDLESGNVSSLGEQSRYGQLAPLPGYSLFVSLDEPATLIVPVADPGTAWEVPGGVADVRGTESLVVHTEDFASTVSHYDGTEQQGEPVAFKVRIDGGILTDVGAVVIDTGGGVDSVDFGAGSHELLTTLGIGIDAAVPLGRGHLLAWGSTGTAVVAIDGTVEQVIDPLPDADGERQPLQPTPGGLGSKCVSLQPGPGMHVEGAGASLWDIETRTQLVKLDATPTPAGPDGCTVVTVGNPAQVVIDGVLVDLGLVGVQAISPDRSQVVGREEPPGGEARMVLVTIADGSRVPLAVGGHFYARY